MAASHRKANHEPGGLKSCNDHLMSQLQSGLAELKTMVSKYPKESVETTHNIEAEHKKQTQQQQQKEYVSHRNHLSRKGNIKPKRSTPKRSTSTPKIKVRKRTPIGKNNSTFSKSTHSALLSDIGNLKPRKTTNFNKLKDKLPVKAILVSARRLKTPRKSNRVCFSSADKEANIPKEAINTPMMSYSEKEVDTTMMGYDWIAGMVDNDSSLNDKPDNFFDDLKEFRKNNWNDCKSIKTATDTSMCESSQLATPVKHTDKENLPLCCTGNGAYMLNNRLNMIPVHGPFSGCPVCKTKATSDSDGYIRVTIPKSTIKSPYHLRPHRRRSFDPSDSVALSMHCLAGWQASKPSCIRGPSNIDLASHTAKPGLTSVKALKGATFKH